MRETLQEIIDLQGEFAPENTPAMQRRGTLIRKLLPQDILERWPELGAALGPYGADLEVHGRDGTGLKSHIPWVRLFSKSKSPSAQEGWYVVYLFHPDGSGVSLCLSHGSTTWADGAFVERTDAEAEELMGWAAGVIGKDIGPDTPGRPGVELGPFKLARAYEKTTAFSHFYRKGAVPDDTTLRADLLAFTRLLARFYRAQDLGLAPDAPSPEVRQLKEQVEQFAAPLKGKPGGQGWGLSPAARKLVEFHAMGQAREWLTKEGFTFVDVSKTDSCDFRAKRGGEEWVVEVKGTTGGPGSVLVTRNEVALHRKSHPRNALLVVHGVVLKGDTSVSGGELVAYAPWLVEDERLSPICYEYRLG